MKFKKYVCEIENTKECTEKKIISIGTIVSWSLFFAIFIIEISLIFLNLGSSLILGIMFFINIFIFLIAVLLAIISKIKEKNIHKPFIFAMIFISAIIIYVIMRIFS